MSSLVYSEMIFSEQFNELSYEEQIIYAGVIYSIVVDNFKNIDYVDLINNIDDIIIGLDEIVNTFIGLELVDYLEDILEIRESIKKSIKKL